MDAIIIPFPTERIKPVRETPEKKLDFTEALEEYISKSSEQELELVQLKNAFAHKHGPIKDFNAHEIGVEVIKNLSTVSYVDAYDTTSTESDICYDLLDEWGDKTEPVAVFARTPVFSEGKIVDYRSVEFIGHLEQIEFEQAYANWHQTFNECDYDERVELGFREPHLYMIVDKTVENRSQRTVISEEREGVYVPLSRIELICELTQNNIA